MAAARSYRDDLQCPHCGSNWLPKDGRSRGKQTYRSRLCHYRFTPDGNRHYYSEQIKEQAFDLYGEGMAVAAISRVLEVKLGTVYEWVKKVRWALGIWAWVTMQCQQWGIVPAISFDELKRLARATTGYTEQVWVLRGSLALLCLRPRRGQKSNASAC